MLFWVMESGVVLKCSGDGIAGCSVGLRYLWLSDLWSSGYTYVGY